MTIQNNDTNTECPSVKPLQKVHHKWGYCTYEGLPDIRIEYKGEELFGVVTGLHAQNFHIRLRDYPDYILYANRGSRGGEWEKARFINDTCSGLSDFGLERAVELMKRIYDLYHDPETGEYRDLCTPLREAAERICLEFEDDHAEEYADIYLLERKRVWDWHVNKRLVIKARHLHGEKWRDDGRIATALAEIRKRVEDLNEAKRKYVYETFENYAKHTLHVDNPYDYVDKDCVCSRESIVGVDNYISIVVRKLQNVKADLDEARRVFYSKLSKKLDPIITEEKADKRQLRQYLRENTITPDAYLFFVTYLKYSIALTEEEKVMKLRNLLLDYAKDVLGLDNVFVQGYIYHITKHPTNH